MITAVAWAVFWIIAMVAALFGSISLFLWLATLPQRAAERRRTREWWDSGVQGYSQDFERLCYNCSDISKRWRPMMKGRCTTCDAFTDLTANRRDCLSPPTMTRKEAHQ